MGHASNNNIVSETSFSFKTWNSKLIEVERSHICTSSYLNDLILMGQEIEKYHESLNSYLLKERSNAVILTEHIKFYKSRYERERTKRIALQQWLESSIPDFRCIYASSLNERLLSFEEETEENSNLHDPVLNDQDVPTQQNGFVNIPRVSFDDEKQSKILCKEYESSLISESSTYKQVTPQRDGPASFHPTHSPLSPSFYYSDTENHLDPSPHVDDTPPVNDEATEKWEKLKEVKTALLNLRTQKEVLFKETESILLYKRQLLSEIQLLEYHMSLLKMKDKEKKDANFDVTELKNTIQSELEVIRANGGLYSRQSISNPPSNSEISLTPNLFSMSHFSVDEFKMGCGSKRTDGDDVCSHSDSSSIFSYPNSFPEASHPLLSPKSSYLLSNRRASLGPHIPENSNNQKKSKKNGKLHLGLSSVSNAIIKFKDKLSNDDSGLTLNSSSHLTSKAYSEFQSKGSSAVYAPLKERNVSCSLYSHLDYKPHIFSITHFETDFHCCVCQLVIHKSKSKELKCLQCGIVSHAHCVPFITESCSMTTNSTSLTSSARSSKETPCNHSIPLSFPLVSKVPLTSNISDTTQESSKMFGVDLISQVNREGRLVPLILEFCLSSVEAFGGLALEGIYRKSGPVQCIRSLVQAFENGIIPDLRSSAMNSLVSNSESLDSTENNTLPLPAVDLCVTTSVLKQYLRELPNPLITFAIYPVVCSAIHKNASKVKEALKDLPKPHWDTLVYLFKHLKLVVDNSVVNRMNSRNLGVVFGPTLMRHASHTDVYDMAGIQVVEYLLDHHVEIFESHSSTVPSTIYKQPSQLFFRDIHQNPVVMRPPDQIGNRNDKQRRLSVIF